jgi:hypothetical protein
MSLAKYEGIRKWLVPAEVGGDPAEMPIEQHGSTVVL